MKADVYDKALQIMMDYITVGSVYDTDEEEDEEDYDGVSCTNCGDDGCLHCEPSRFLKEGGK